VSTQARVVPNHWDGVSGEPHVQFKSVAAALNRVIEGSKRVLHELAATTTVSQQQHSLQSNSR
jgi:hypothetical protein